MLTPQFCSTSNDGAKYTTLAVRVSQPLGEKIENTRSALVANRVLMQDILEI